MRHWLSEPRLEHEIGWSRAEWSSYAASTMLAERYDHSVLKELLLDPAARRERSSVSGPLNYLLVGSDLRAGSSTTEAPSGGRSRPRPARPTCW